MHCHTLNLVMSANSNYPWAPSGSSPSGSPPVREDQVVQAVHFMNDARTRHASQQEKESFLRQKGLTDAEIAASLARSNPATVTSLYIPPPIIEEPILWSAVKSIFSAVGAMAIGVMGYHMYSEGDRKEQSRDQPPSSSSSDALNLYSPPVGAGVSEEKLNEAIRQLSTAQELRHKELLVSIRQLSSRVESISHGGRKPGGSVVPPVEPVVTASAPAVESPVTAVADRVDVTIEDLNLEAEVAEAISNKLDGTINLILCSIDKNKRINKSNARFKKLEGVKLMRFCGYKEGPEFFELQMDQLDTYRANATRVISEIKRQRELGAGKSIEPGNTPVDKSQASADSVMQPAVQPPWVTKALDASSHPIALSGDVADLSVERTQSDTTKVLNSD